MATAVRAVSLALFAGVVAAVVVPSALAFPKLYVDYFAETPPPAGDRGYCGGGGDAGNVWTTRFLHRYHGG